MNPAIRTEHLTVRYGRHIAVDDVSFGVEPGSVYALLGRNGSGKSSLTAALLGQLHPAQGRAELLGEDAWRKRRALMERVGVVAEEADAPVEMRVAELGAFCARLYARWNQGAYDERLARFGIGAAKRFGELSKGQRKQVSLALALASAPELLILDDPTLGLDVVARKALFEEVIADLADRGITVFITTHDLAPVESIADRVGILKGGRLVLDEETETLKARFRRIRFANQAMVLAQTGLRTASVRGWGSGTEAVISNYDDLELARLRDTVHVSVAEVSPMSLEEIFLAVVGEKAGDES